MKVPAHWSEFLAEHRLAVLRGTILITTAFVVTMMMTALLPAIIQPPGFHAGEIASATVRSTHDFSVEIEIEGAKAVQHIRRGETIVRVGDPISTVQETKLKKLREFDSGRHAGWPTIAYFFLSCATIFIAFFFSAAASPRFRPSVKELTTFSLVLIGSFALLQLYLLMSKSLSIYFPDLDDGAVLLAAPVAAGGILLQVILGFRYVAVYSMVFAMLTGLFLSNAVELVTVIYLGNFIGALSVQRSERRSAFVRAGFRVAGLNVFLSVAFLFAVAGPSWSLAAPTIVSALIGGLTAGILGSALVPVAEYFGSYLTDVRLLELSSLDHPLLRDLSVQAPGTWNHSMIIGQMGEAAAEAIGANSLLARVGAYYHDIGKAKKPAYFVENQTEKENRHDKLPPSMSALIIKSHVKDGIEIARQYSLPEPLIDLIPQHHGTALIGYFFDKAKREAEEGEVVDEAHYRYPGPKPQTKEAGILMLADGVEAASRTISDPTPAKIQGAVQKIMNKVFVSGQLEECELTLKDLHLIAKSFSRVLNGIFHRRVEYSEPAEKRARGESGETSEESNGRRNNSAEVYNKHPEETSSDEGAEANNQDALKRLGL